MFKLYGCRRHLYRCRKRSVYFQPLISRGWKTLRVCSPANSTIGVCAFRASMQQSSRIDILSTVAFWGMFIFSRWNSAAEKHCEFAHPQTRRLTYARSAHQCNSLRELIFSQLLHFKECLFSAAEIASVITTAIRGGSERRVCLTQMSRHKEPPEDKPKRAISFASYHFVEIT